MKRLLLLPIVIFVSLAVFAEGTQPKHIELNAEEQQLVTKNNDFALNLFLKVREDQLSSLNVQPSTILSPLSITFDLGMLDNGADGITREEIDAVLGSEGVGGADAINQFCCKLLTGCSGLDEKTRIAIANNIYVNKAMGCELLPDFVKAASQYYGATPESRDFGDGLTRDVINRWGSDHTEGMIEEAIKADEFKPNALSYLLNALYFKGEWTHKFNAGETRLYQFDQGRAEVQMMHQQTDFPYVRNDVYQSVILPYGNTAFQMNVFLPNWGKTIDDVLERMKGGKWQNQYDACNVNLYMPKFETSTDMHLEDIMKALGMPNAFEGGYGFNRFCNEPGVFIGMMKQVAKIKLDEEGSEASAVTVIDIRKNASGPSYAELVCDRPFLYTISERSTGAILFIGQYMGEPLKNVRHDISLTPEERKLVQSNNDFAFNLFRKVRLSPSSEQSEEPSAPNSQPSTILSPLSITFALGMMNNGAAGQTQQEINNVLGFGSAGADAINQFCRKLLSEAPTLDETTSAEIANTVFVNSGQGYELQQGFIDKASAFYDAQPQALNFYETSQAIGIINGWANVHTHGMIPYLFSSENSFNKNAATYLLNALYFKGAWTNKFNKEQTRDEPFDGGQTVPMMHQWEEFFYAENDLCQTIRLPYGNEAYQMTVFLPREDKTIDDVLATLNGSNWTFPAYRYEVDLKLPRFSTSASIPLADCMKALGMPTAFTQQAEFPYFGNRNICITSMFQKAAIDLDEEGTEAAAVTVIGAETTSIPRTATFHADRPFLYIISEQSTGAIFFIGQYTGPDTAMSIDRLTPSAKKEGETADGLPSGRSREWFNLNGQRTAQGSQPGIYIKAGKKIAVK